MTEQPSLAEWFAACLDEDAAAAEAAGGATWTFYNAWGTSVDSEAGTVVYDEGAPTEAQAKHIAAWDPARVLAEVTAKRRILAEHPSVGPIDDRYSWSRDRAWCERCSDADEGATFYPCQTVRLLALPYAGRDGYQEAWGPA